VANCVVHTLASGRGVVASGLRGLDPPGAGWGSYCMLLLVKAQRCARSSFPTTLCAGWAIAICVANMHLFGFDEGAVELKDCYARFCTFLQLTVAGLNCSTLVR
jgi:hypothetical protein